ncbi:MAG TPA: hypothetical protein DCE08_06420 [Ruminococcaceae bacterium]|nr:hypothetical protein [Oscillospiraceae bacterium]
MRDLVKPTAAILKEDCRRCFFARLPCGQKNQFPGTNPAKMRPRPSSEGRGRVDTEKFKT